MAELTPQTREEHFLARIAGDPNALVLEPVTRIEHFLQKIIDNGGPSPGPGGAVSSVNGKTGAVVLVPSDIGAEPAKLTVTVTQSGSTYSANKTFSEMWTAYDTDHKTISVAFADDEYILSNATPSGMAFTSLSVGSGNGELKMLSLNESDEWAYSVFMAGQITETVSGTTPTIAPAANTIYNCGELASLTVSSFPASGKFWIWFDSGATPTATVGIANFAAEANKRYRITVEDGYATYDAWPAGGVE